MVEYDENYPLQSHLGYSIYEWSDGRAVIELKIKPYHYNRHKIPHGGVYATLLDTAMGFAGSFPDNPENKRFALTLTMTCNFLSRPKGDILYAEGQVVGGGKNTFFSEGTLRDNTGEIIATSVGTFRIRNGIG